METELARIHTTPNFFHACGIVTEKGQIYVCEICGNKVQVLETGAGTLVCCGQDMTLIE